MMKNTNRSLLPFFALLRAGLWEYDVQLSQVDGMDCKGVYQLAEEQSVVGLLAAGLEHVVDSVIPKEGILTFIGSALQLEQHNKAMNSFVGSIIDYLRKEGVYALLIKGQGIAQCYERPLWRACGDVDLFLCNENYEKAKKI